MLMEDVHGRYFIAKSLLIMHLYLDMQLKVFAEKSHELVSFFEFPCAENFDLSVTKVIQYKPNMFVWSWIYGCENM